MEEEILKNFDLNIFNVFREVYKSEIENKKNEIGASDLSSCGRQLIIMKNEGISNDLTIKMLFGTMGHLLIQHEPVLYGIFQKIYNELGIKIKKDSIVKEKSDLVEIYPEYFLRIHTDVFTNKYLIEIKWTGVYTRYWVREIAFDNMEQLNTYLGHWKVDLGFLCRINWRVIFEGITSVQGEDYWNKLWMDYGFFLAHKFDNNMYNNSIEKVKLLAQGIEEYNINLFPNCNYDWQCGVKYCPAEVREKCGKVDYTCKEMKESKDGKLSRCNKISYEFPNELTEKYKREQICEACFIKQNPHSKYLKYKYINYKKKEKELSLKNV